MFRQEFVVGLLRINNLVSRWFNGVRWELIENDFQFLLESVFGSFAGWFVFPISRLGWDDPVPFNSRVVRKLFQRTQVGLQSMLVSLPGSIASEIRTYGHGANHVLASQQPAVRIERPTPAENVIQPGFHPSGYTIPKQRELKDPQICLGQQSLFMFDVPVGRIVL